MKVIIAKDYAELSRLAADIVGGVVKEKPDCLIGLATGSSPVGLYKELIRRNKAGELDFSRVRTVNLDEYVGLAPEHPQSYRYFMNVNLFDHINIDKKNTAVPDGLCEDPAAFGIAYDEKIEKAGGIDVQVLGIGPDGHIGFNEPGEFLTAHTHEEKLQESTIDANARFFADRNDVPRTAITMGMMPIMQAKKIVLVANGENKKKVLFEAIDGKITPKNPASLLQLHPDVTIIFCD